MKRTKIVCTIGPSSEDETTLKRMAHHGMNVCRLAFSHGTYAEYAELMKRISRVESELCLPLAIMQDLQGPRIRIGKVPEAGINLSKGADCALVSQQVFDKEEEVSRNSLPIQYPELYRHAKEHDTIYISDGNIELSVQGVEKQRILCKVTKPGIVYTHKGINLPDTVINGPVITEKDKKDLRFGVEHGIDFVALSFVRSKEDIVHLRRLLCRYEKKKTTDIQIIAKIERKEAITNFDEIIEASDGIMVARGDLGIELPPSEVPILQKDLIARCLHAAKPVIVATQMLESMMENPRPTRAEVSDVANAVIDHTDAVMLSGETASGKYPCEAVEMMADIIRRTERSPLDDMTYANEPLRVLNLLLFSVVKQMQEQRLNTLIVLARTNILPQLLSNLRMEKNVFVATENARLARQMSLMWGIQPILVNALKTSTVIKSLHAKGELKHAKQALLVDEQSLRIAQSPVQIINV